MSLLALPLSTSGRLPGRVPGNLIARRDSHAASGVKGKPDPLWILILFFSLYDAMHEHRYDFFCQAVNRLRGLQSRQAVDIKHGEAVDQRPSADCCHLQSSRVILGNLECPVFAAPLQYRSIHSFYRSESMDNFGGKPCVLPLQFRTKHEAIPRGISCTKTQIGDQDCFQRISRFCLSTQSSEHAGPKNLVTLRRDGSEELSFACEVGVRGIVAHPCAACYFAQ